MTSSLETIRYHSGIAGEEVADMIDSLERETTILREQVEKLTKERDAEIARKLGKVERQSAALKLAREALESCDVGDCSIDPMVMPSFDAVAVDEALAAIDEVLKGD